MNKRGLKFPAGRLPKDRGWRLEVQVSAPALSAEAREYISRKTEGLFDGIRRRGLLRPGVKHVFLVALFEEPLERGGQDEDA